MTSQKVDIRPGDVEIDSTRLHKTVLLDSGTSSGLPQSPDLNPTESLWDVGQLEIGIAEICSSSRATPSRQYGPEALRDVFQHFIESTRLRIKRAPRSKDRPEPGANKVCQPTQPASGADRTEYHETGLLQSEIRETSRGLQTHLGWVVEHYVLRQQ